MFTKGCLDKYELTLGVKGKGIHLKGAYYQELMFHAITKLTTLHDYQLHTNVLINKIF